MSNYDDDRHEPRTVDRVTDDGDGDVTVWLDNGAWLTVRKGDLLCALRPGDRVIVQLPRIVSVDKRRDGLNSTARATQKED